MAKKYQLTIDASYLPNWGIQEGLRELLQNARDAEVQHGAKLSVEFKKRRVMGRETGAIVITNEGCTMPLKALLIGHTTKAGDSETIGQFGEGLKFGMLVLLRGGMNIKIRNGGEVWIPMIERHADFDSDVLAVEVSSGRKDSDRVSFEIIGVSKENYEECVSRCLWLREMNESTCHKFTSGSLLTEPKEAGRIYVKGLFVCRDDKLTYGFDFRDADIDRDRRMLSDKDSLSQQVIAAALNKESTFKIIAPTVFEMLEEGHEIGNYIRWSLSPDAISGLHDNFEEKYGVGAIPCDSEVEAQELGHFGKKGVVVHRHLKRVVEVQTGTAAEVIKKLRLGDKVRYDLSELEGSEAKALQVACSYVVQAQLDIGEVEPIGLDNVLVVDFHKDTLKGTYTHDAKTVRIARRVLSDLPDTIAVIVHEVAHKYGKDGDTGHEAAEMRLFREIMRRMMNAQSNADN